ncbi:MAG TPA: response regulator [Thermoanaerobaculia bacterium]|nr:response regulator [Thermoanaerobaculia bacterium]
MILLVEDEDAVAEGIGALLALENWEVLRASGVREALELSDREPRMAIIDVSLGDGDGRDLGAALRKTYPELPLLFISGHITRSELGEIASSGKTAFLQKPFGSSSLLESINQLLET